MLGSSFNVPCLIRVVDANWSSRIGSSVEFWVSMRYDFWKLSESSTIFN